MTLPSSPTQDSPQHVVISTLSVPHNPPLPPPLSGPPAEAAKPLSAYITCVSKSYQRLPGLRTDYLLDVKHSQAPITFLLAPVPSKRLSQTSDGNPSFGAAHDIRPMPPRRTPAAVRRTTVVPQRRTPPRPRPRSVRLTTLPTTAAATTSATESGARGTTTTCRSAEPQTRGPPTH
ncbi:unnamed protein product [Arctogadus glacialis]